MSDPAQHGDRAAFLARLRVRQAPPLTIGAHAPPPPPGVVPEVRFRVVDGIAPGDHRALAEVFRAAATRVEARVHDVDDATECLGAVVARHDVVRAVVSSEPEATALIEPLRALGVTVEPYSPAAASTADLGVTSAVAGVAATGSVVVDADRAGGRGASLVPRVHFCVLPADRLVASPSDVLRRHPGPLPSNRVLITGPSRTGDIEQIITLGVHGPVALEVALCWGSIES